MKHYVFAALLLTGLAAQGQGVPNWRPFVLDSHLTVELPAKAKYFGPTETGQVLAVRSWATRTPQAGFFIVRVPTMLPVTKGDTAQRHRYYRSLIKSTLTDTHSRLLSRTTFLTAGIDGVELKLRSIDNVTGSPTIRYMRSIVLGSFGYDLLFQSATPNDSVDSVCNAQRRRFFNSITVKP